MTDALLVLNVGSSSIKFQAFAADTLNELAKGAVADINGAMRLTASVDAGAPLMSEPPGHGHDAALTAVLGFFEEHHDDWRIAGVAHRIVHGGTQFTAPVIVTPAIVAALEALAPLAPLHQPHNLAGLIASARLAAHAPDIACFDTAFHASLPPLARTFALPQSVRDQGVRRFGFHGLSYEWIARVLAAEHPALASGRVVVAHLGNGASLCALQAGRSVDTTMGLTALDGLPMGTRSGAIDPGVLLYLLQARGMTPADLERMLYADSGLKGLSGTSSDVATLLASDDPRAAFALDHFAARVAQHVAMMATSMGGINALVFTGGIGEHAASVCHAIVQRLAWLGRFEVLVIPANEERMMAIHAKALLASAPAA